MGLCRMNEETCVCYGYEDVLLDATLFIFADGTMVRSSALGRSVSKSCLRTYRFQRWDDGDTTNLRRIVVTQDTAFIAMFTDPEGIEPA